MSIVTITIGSDYTAVPGGRFAKYGPFSGEDFRDNHLVPALRANAIASLSIWMALKTFLELCFSRKRLAA